MDMNAPQGGLQPQQDPSQQPGQTAQGMQGAPGAQAGVVPQGPNPAAASAQPTQPTADDKLDNYLDYAFSQSNLAKKLKEKTTKSGELVLDLMGEELMKGIEEDITSRQPWLDKNDEWMKLAMLVRETKTYPWPKASNVKYPLLATAAMQFSARAYPALVPTDGHIVKTRVVQKDPSDQIYAAAERIGQHMSYQILERIPGWEEDMDKLLMTMAISGICFKKTYHASAQNCHHSHIVYPENLIVNYYAKCLEKAYRKTEILHYTKNDLQEKVLNDEEFLDLKLDRAPEHEPQGQSDKHVVTGILPPPSGPATPFTFYACHTFWDLDEDGYEEPYIVTIHKETRKVVRIIARWEKSGVHRNDKNEITMIEPWEYYTAFPFIPNPDGSIYALGFGILLGPLNEAVNSIINQLVDSGTLNNMQSGFIGKGLRMRMGQTYLQPGEWKVVNATGDDLSKSIYPMPSKEPSAVLYQLLQMLITSGNQLASIAEIFVGKMPGQNTPATTTQETIQQGMAVFTAIYKRVYRSLASEFKKLYKLNKICPDIVEEESQVAGMPLQQSDYDLPDWIVIPGADPTGDSGSVRMSKLQQVGQLLQMGTIDPMVYTRLVLDANEIPNAQQLIRQPQPQAPDPKTELIKAQTDAVQQKASSDQQGQQQDLQAKQALSQIAQQRDEQKLVHEQQMQALKQAGAAQDAKHSQITSAIDNHTMAMQSMMDLMHSQVKAKQDMQNTQVAHVQNVVHADQKHRQTLTMNAQRQRQAAKAAETAAV